MERFMYQDDSFEQVLKQQADEYRMYPSDQSWEVIHQRLHQPARFRWKLASFFTITLLSAGLWVSVNQHEVNMVSGSLTPILQADVQNNSNVYTTPAKQIKPLIIAAVQKPVIKKDIQQITEQQQTVTTVSVEEPVKEMIEPVEETNQYNETTLTATGAQELKTISLLPAGDFAAAAKEPIALLQETVTQEPENNQTDADLNYEVNVPVITTKKPVKQLQYYITPSTSYRVLVTENNTYNFGNIRDPRSAITQQPFLGLELGVALLKPLNKTFTFTGGLQFNFTSYVVTGSKFSPEVATVTLSPFRNIQRVTSLRTRDGYFDENIFNKTLQVSVPLGVRMDIVEGNRFAWNVSTTLQPTYLITATGYMVTNDYKNYIKAPELLKSFNINYGFETFVRIKSKNSEFQLGPQLRYQLLSNAKASYPIKEHLVDYGIKFGFIKNLK
ncbi:MAG: hypothetical protein HEQ40_16775 [Lacibacter sp.]|jgi:hypothetical protein